MVKSEYSYCHFYPFGSLQSDRAFHAVSDGRPITARVTVPIEFDISVKGVTMQEATTLANTNSKSDSPDMGMNFFYLCNNPTTKVGPNTARGGNSGFLNLSSVSVVKSHEFLHMLGFCVFNSYADYLRSGASRDTKSGSHWKSEDYSHRAMYSYANSDFVTNANVTQADIGRINFGQALKDGVGVGFGWPALNNIYDKSALSDPSNAQPINKTSTNEKDTSAF